MSAERISTLQDGYTLLEMLVALSLTGFLSTALFANVGLGARVWDKVEDRSQQAAAENVLDKVVRRHIELAVPVGLTAGATRQQIFFEGRSRNLRFFTEASAGAMPPGIYGVEFQISGDQDNKALLVRRARVAIGGFHEDQYVAWDESRLMLAGREVDMAYYGHLDGDGEAEWHREWSSQRALPDLVRLSFGNGEEAKTILIAPVLDFSVVKMAPRQFDLYFANIQG